MASLACSGLREMRLSLTGRPRKQGLMAQQPACYSATLEVPLHN